MLDSGYGGTDPSAIANNTQEKDLNLKISQYMYDRFLAQGVPVKIIRSIDETLEPSQRVASILSAYGNDPNVIVISNHMNFASSIAEGAEVIYTLRNSATLSRHILEGLGNARQVIRSYYQR